jgi:MFS family permease
LNRNVRLLILVSWLFGYASGAYEVLFPLYLDWAGISFRDIGIIFSLSAATIAGLNVVIGSKSDARGRKAFYSVGLALCSAANFAVPFFRKLWETLVLSVGQSASASIRGSVHNVMLYEHTRKTFLSAYSRVNGMEYFSQAIGLLGAGLILAASSFQSAFWVSAAVLAGAFCVFAFGFKEEGAGREPAEDGAKRDVGAYLPRELKIFAVSGFVMAIGSGLSHGFITPLFFVKKFGADQATVSIILTLHRLSFGVPMIFADKVLAYLRRFRRKAILIALMIYQGVSISLCAYLPDIVSATIVFVSHDLLAAAFWIPVLSVLIQGFCREGRRGADSNKVGSIGSIGGIGAPFLAGVLASIDIGYPFLASGLFYVAAALILLRI